MTKDPAADFFGALMETGGYVPRLSRCAGSVRFDVTHPDRVQAWRVVIDKGDVTVSQDDGTADAVVSCDKAVMDGILTGEVNPVTATLRGVLAIEGDWDLVLMCQRLFTDPAFATERSQIADAGA